MSTPQEIADRSMKLATDFLEEARQHVLDMSERNFNTLREAAELVRAKARTGPSLSHSAEHLAFSLITAANATLLEEQEKATPPAADQT